MTERLAEIVDKMAGHRLMVLGDYMLDIYWEGSAERISPEAPVPVVHIDWDRVRYLPGGAGNVVRNLQAVGVQCTIGGVLGDDEEADRLMHLPEWLGADPSGLVRWPGRRTVHKARVIARGQHVVRLDWEDASPLTDLEVSRVLAAASAALPKVDGVIFSDYDKGNLTPPLVSPVIKQARAAGKLVVVDPKPANIEWFRDASAITPNESEAAEATGIRISDRGSLQSAGRALLNKLALEAVLVTRGDKGSALFERDREPRFIPAANVAEVYDVSGAGDTVTAVFGAAMLAGATYLEAAVLANIAAGEVIRHVGCYAVTPLELHRAIADNADYIASVTD